MGGSTAKKVIVERYDRQVLRGFVHPQSCRTPDGFEIVSPEGGVTLVPYNQIKCVSFVRDIDGSGALSQRREFLARPKVAGLWIELHFLDEDSLEASIPNNLLEMDLDGLMANPPETAGNAQRIFVPRVSLNSVVVLGVVGRIKPKRTPLKPTPRQATLFD